MIQRWQQPKVIENLENFPCLALVGPRQSGKTTLAKLISGFYPGSVYLDLESQRDLSRLEDAEFYLEQHENNLVIIDEVQRKRELFPVLRSLIDRNRKPGRFLLLGSASPELIRNSSETLAGRIVYMELTPFTVTECTGIYAEKELWMFGGYPEAIIRRQVWATWMKNFILTYVERDLPQLGFNGNRMDARRLWSMLAHYQGNLLEYSDLGKSLGLSLPTIKNYLGFLEQAFLIRRIEPFHSNLKKRLVKSPKVYIRDSGILHYLLGLSSFEELMGHPKSGSSWEGFVIEQIIAMLPGQMRYYFYRTHDGAELDLVITRGDAPLIGIEIKLGSDTRPSRGNTESINSLGTPLNFIVSSQPDEYRHSSGFYTCGLTAFLEKHLPQAILT
jgi:predicted AAA+ superfamily ATPase